ncbi:hypothetical protein DRO34_05380 [Candidatus Bathyarchaeota archaeon]|nr:MAG: hypothetical protein DRO34_05380 [Candidatus Bathyarchaeota archaeon]
MHLEVLLHKLFVLLPIGLFGEAKGMKQELAFAKLVKFMCCSMHSTFFAVFTAVKERLGFFGCWEASLKAIDEMGFNCLEFVEGDTLQEKLRTLEKYGFFQGMTLKREGNKFIFKIDKCQFAGGKEGIHKNILEHKIEAPCPLTLIIAQFLKQANPRKRLYVYPTVFTEWGAKTEIELLTPRKYQEKKNQLVEFVALETREILFKNKPQH